MIQILNILLLDGSISSSASQPGTSLCLLQAQLYSKPSLAAPTS